MKRNRIHQILTNAAEEIGAWLFTGGIVYVVVYIGRIMF